MKMKMIMAGIAAAALVGCSDKNELPQVGELLKTHFYVHPYDTPIRDAMDFQSLRYEVTMDNSPELEHPRFKGIFHDIDGETCKIAPGTELYTAAVDDQHGVLVRIEKTEKVVFDRTCSEGTRLWISKPLMKVMYLAIQQQQRADLIIMQRKQIAEEALGKDRYKAIELKP